MRGAINTCSHANDWQRGFNPFVLGPVTLADGRQAALLENAWQYAKVYPEHADGLGNPTSDYWGWSQKGMASRRAVRYPMGKGRKPLYALLGDEHLGYVEARKRIYFPLYRDAVRSTPAWARLKEIFAQKGTIVLFDFDGYNRGQQSFAQVLNNPNRICGHAVVLAMMLCYGEEITLRRSPAPTQHTQNWNEQQEPHLEPPPGRLNPHQHLQPGRN